MGTLYDKSGNPVEVPDAQMTSALLSGQYGTDKDAVTVKSGGKVYSVPTANLGKFAAGAPDLKVMSDADVAAHEQEKQKEALQAKYGGLGSQAIVAGTGALGGATLGISDALLGQVLSQGSKEKLAQMREANPYTDIGSNVVGAVLPSVLSGGAAAPEEAAALAAREGVTEAGTIAKALGGAKAAFTAPTRALEAVSGLAERGTGMVVGHEAESFAGQLAQKAITKAAGGAVTGGLATGAMDVGENELSPDHNLTGEQLLQHMSMGALFGAGLGAVGGAGGATLEKALSSDGEKASGGFGDWIRGKAEERQWFATGAKTPETKALAKTGLTPGEVGRWQLDNLSKYTEDGSAPLTREAIGEAATKAVDTLGPQVGAHIETLDAIGATPKWEPILDRLRSEVVEPLADHIDPAVKNIANRVGGLIDNAETKLGESPTFKELFDLRRDVQNAINYNKADLTQATANSELKKVRNIIEDEIGKQGEIAAGPEWAEHYNATKKDYRMASATQTAFESADARVASHNPVSLESSIIGSSGLAGLALGHPAALVASGAAAVGRHLLKTYGDAVGSRLLDAITKTGALQSTVASAVAAKSVVAAQKTYSQAVSRGIGALTRGAVVAAQPGRPSSTDGAFARNSAQVKQVLSNPQAHAQAIDSNAKALGQNFATTASAYQRSALSTSTYLAQQLPKSKPIDPMSPKAGVIEPSQADKVKFNKLFDAVTDPTGILHSAASGTLTRDVVDAVAVTHPATLADMQKRITAEMKTLKEPLDPAQAASVKMILGVPVFDRPAAPLATPQAMPPQGGGKRPKSATSRPLKLNVTATTGLVGSRVGS